MTAAALPSRLRAPVSRTATCAPENVTRHSLRSSLTEEGVMFVGSHQASKHATGGQAGDAERNRAPIFS